MNKTDRTTNHQLFSLSGSTYGQQSLAILRLEVYGTGSESKFDRTMKARFARRRDTTFGSVLLGSIKLEQEYGGRIMTDVTQPLFHPRLWLASLSV